MKQQILNNKIMIYLIFSLLSCYLLIGCNHTNDGQLRNQSTNHQDNSKSVLEKPKIVCSDEYLEVTKDTYNYYLKKLEYSGLTKELAEDADATLMKKLESDEIICFLSLSEYGEAENILVEPFKTEINQEIFDYLKNAIESQQMTNDDENVIFRLMDSGKGMYGDIMPYYYFKTVTIVKEYNFIRCSLTFLIEINDKPYSIVINTHDIEKDIHNTIISINDIESDRSF
jgi:hypothetical protein